MAKLKTVKDVQNAFLDKSVNGNSIYEHINLRYEDIEKLSPVVEHLLATDCNQVGKGLSIDEVVSALSSAKTNIMDRSYTNQVGMTKDSVKISESVATESMEMISEAFGETTVGQSPFPVPSIAFTQYIYEKSVAPFFAHIFDLEGNRGLVYYQKFTAKNAEGNVAEGDLLASPRQLGVQTQGFVGGKVIAEEIGVTTTSDTEYTHTLANKPTPGTLIVRVAGTEGYFQDFASAENTTGEVQLYAIKGNPGTCTVDYSTGEVTVTFATAPTVADMEITADYVREIQTIDTEDIAEVVMTVESETLIAEDFAVKLNTNVQQERLSKAIFGREWNQMAEDGMGALYNREVANKIMGETKAEIITDSTATHDLSANIATGGNNNLFNVAFMQTVIPKLGQLIRTASGLGCTKAAAIGIAADLIPIFQALPGFTLAEDKEDNMGGAQLVGAYQGTPVVVFFENVLGSGEMVGIYKSQTSRFLAPYVFGEFIKPMIRTIFDQNNLSVQRMQLIASAAGKVVAPRLAAQITVNNIGEVI